jgi:hypothetical protein
VIRASQSLLYEFDPVGGNVVWDGDTRHVIGTDAASVSSVRAWLERVHPDDRVRLKGLRRQLTSGETREFLKKIMEAFAARIERTA